MRVAVCADMEGLAGVDRYQQCFPSWRHDYRHGVRMLVADVRVAAQAALDSGARDVVLADWHYMGRNIPRAAFPGLPIRRLWHGGRPLVGPAGLGGPDVAVLVGVHAGAGNPKGFMSHTFWRGMAVLLDGTPLSETVLWALALGGQGIPVAVVAGDQQAGEEARALLPGVRTVAVKAGVSRTRAILRAPDDAREEIAEAVRRALGEPPGPMTHPFPATITVRYGRRSWAARAERRGIGARAGPRDVSLRLGSVHDLGPFLARALQATPPGTSPTLANTLLPVSEGAVARAWVACLLATTGWLERMMIRSWARERASLYPPVGAAGQP